ncbi:COG4648 family protein [Methylomonas rapida]|uniref:DNA gyrase subunit B n=1 Tax=Methylomonas rapida TaxID=2963939 RepID=A0ABY7GPI8_9GAMM|nr:hypothetical protein [Methylomonas rapida]WAR46416.1 hypothetical protein NM686_007835 [Methylomonas rapida]
MPKCFQYRWLRLGLNALIAAATVSYPFLIWFSLDFVQPRVLALLLAGLFWLRFLLRESQASNQGLMLMIPVSILLLLAIAWSNRGEWLLAYPVLVSLAFFALFFSSLLYPPTMIERLARLEDPDLPPKGVAYTRKVTQVWSVFFLCNAAVSLATILYGDRWLWGFYNGFVSYILMGLLMAAEMAVRRKVRASY